MKSVIRCVGLTKSFGGKRALDRLDLNVPPGSIYALLGDNGAGKSTTIRILTGQMQADRGKAEVLGDDAWSSAYELRHRVGYVPEKPRYYDWMTVEEVGGFVAGFHHGGFRKRYRALIERYTIERHAVLSSLSKGEYARVGLALALASDPELLILDEPTSGLDLFTRREFLSSMVELANNGRTILICSHGIAEVERVASHAAFLSKGKLLLAGAMDELRHRVARVRVLHDGRKIPASPLGNVLEFEQAGREWAAVVLDLVPTRVEELRRLPGVISVDRVDLTLEEIYVALLAQARAGKPLMAALAEEEEEEPVSAWEAER
jgi:ABC-2 type transport system ATP-binding protein